MKKEATLQVRMEADLKEQAELLYKNLGTSFAEAVRIFARQSVQENGMPFMLRIPPQKAEQRIGLAKGLITVPENIDKYNDEVADLFGGSQ